MGPLRVTVLYMSLVQHVSEVSGSRHGDGPYSSAVIAAGLCFVSRQLAVDLAMATSSTASSTPRPNGHCSMCPLSSTLWARVGTKWFPPRCCSLTSITASVSTGPTDGSELMIRSRRGRCIRPENSRPAHSWASPWSLLSTRRGVSPTRPKAGSESRQHGLNTARMLCNPNRTWTVPTTMEVIR